MISSKLFESKIARTTFYIVFVGGLFFVFSVLFAALSNDILSEYFEIPELSLLEAGGLFAIFHIVYSGIKFGYNKFQKSSTEEDMSLFHDCDNMTEVKKHINLDSLSTDDKNRLKEEIAKCCGIKKEKQELISKTQKT